MLRVAKSNNYAKLANKTLEDLEIGASGRTDAETERKENPLFALWKAAKREKFLGTARGDLVVLVGTSNVQLWRLQILGIPSTSMVEGQTLSFHHTNEIAQSEAKLARPSPTTGCTTDIEWTMRKCQNHGQLCNGS